MCFGDVSGQRVDSLSWYCIQSSTTVGHHNTQPPLWSRRSATDPLTRVLCRGTDNLSIRTYLTGAIHLPLGSTSRRVKTLKRQEG